jgi:hypothetical protein
VLGVAFILTGRYLGAALLLGLAVLASTCAWAFWPADR